MLLPHRSGTLWGIWVDQQLCIQGSDADTSPFTTRTGVILFAVESKLCAGVTSEPWLFAASELELVNLADASAACQLAVVHATGPGFR